MPGMNMPGMGEGGIRMRAIREASGDASLRHGEKVNQPMSHILNAFRSFMQQGGGGLLLPEMMLVLFAMGILLTDYLLEPGTSISTP